VTSFEIDKGGKIKINTGDTSTDNNQWDKVLGASHEDQKRTA
jgi:hypothetical protein